jgi:DNA-binding MarR family transcriptional regulator/N-acetylglutamate synthase-like GNAT family acetyltransferase
MQREVEAVRRFNRLYTRRIRVLAEAYLDSPYTLAEARVLFELGRAPDATATGLGKDLALDLGYLSRLLQGLKRRGLVQAKKSPSDARLAHLSLTEKGRKAFALLNGRSHDEVVSLLSSLPKADRGRLVAAMGSIERLLEERSQEEAPRSLVLRAHRPGDMGWVVQRHGEIYFEEYGWDERFEAVVAEIAAAFIRRFDAKKERCWIAEVDGERVGSAFVVRQAATVAKLRLVIVTPEARGLGIGKRLVQECVAFARAKGYRKLVLWTQANLTAARGIYRKAGFEPVKSEVHRSFGPKVTGEYWELRLQP